MVSVMVNDGLNVINFSTHDFHGSIDINNLVKVIAIPALSLAPDGPDYIVGLINYSGNIIPVIDLTMRMQTGELKKYSLSTPMMICKLKNKQMFGIVVDKVDDICLVTSEMLQANVTQKHDDLVSGAIKYDGHISLIFDVEKLLEGYEVLPDAKIVKEKISE